MRTFTLSLIAISIFASLYEARADKWSLFPGLKKKEYTFGELNCLLVEDGKEGGLMVYPIWEFTCSRGGKLLFKKERYGADVISATKDGAFIVGISNSGFTEFDYWIIDHTGRVIAEKKHKVNHSEAEQLKPPHYCEMSKSIFMKWFDEKKPNVQFKIKDQKLTDVEVTACNGKRLSLSAITPFSQ